MAQIVSVTQNEKKDIETMFVFFSVLQLFQIALNGKFSASYL